MKLVFTLFVISSLIFASCSIDQANTEQKKEKTPAVNEDKNAGIYGYESGMVETHFGDTKNKEILYFDKWGTLSAKYVYTENRNSGEVIISSIEIIKNGITFFIDPVAKTGLKMGNPFGKNEIGDAKEILGFQEERKIKMLGSHLSGTDLLNGKKCSVYRDDAKEMSQTTYIHMGLVLKTIITLDGDEIVSEATDIQFNVTIPADIFEIPKGIRFN
jgi:outer membrane lipoprotein-sorting protein